MKEERISEEKERRKEEEGKKKEEKGSKKEEKEGKKNVDGRNKIVFDGGTDEKGKEELKNVVVKSKNCFVF